MASSGSFNTSAYNATDGTRFLTFSWKETSQSVPNNETTIEWSVVAGGTTKQYIYGGDFKVVIAGKTVYESSKRIKLLQGTSVASGTFKFAHDAKGDASFTASVEAGIYTYAVNCRGSKTFALDNIPRASQPSCITWPEHTQNVGEFGDTISIHMNRKADVFTHTVRYAFGSLKGTIATNVTTGTTWTIPESFMDLLPKSTSGSGTIYVDTYNGSTLIGTKYCGFTATVPASVKPSCTLTVTEETSYGSKYTFPVSGLSQFKFKVTPTLAHGSQIAKVEVRDRYRSTWVQRAAEFTWTPERDGLFEFRATVTDERGRVSDAAVRILIVDPYTPPRITALAVRRCQADGTDDDRGEYVAVVFSAQVTPLRDENSAAHVIRYTPSGGDTVTLSLTELANNYNVFNYEVIFPVSGNVSCDIEVAVTDDIGTGTLSTSVSTAFTLMNWGEDGTSFAMGKVAEEPNTFENALHKRQIGNSYAFQPGAFNGDKGYTALAMITLNTLNVNAPIVFEINRRGALCPMRVYVRFASSSTTTDPDLGSITYEGDNYGAFLIKTAESTWTLYVDNTGGWSNPCLQAWYTTQNQMARIGVTFPAEQLEELPTPYYRATPAKMQSILDYIYPVGSVYISYSHVSPATMFGGTWERIKNAFLWAVDENGEIGLTGGEKTHTLTANELPKHSHGSVYSGNVSGTKTHSWIASGGSNMAYGTVETGGGAAHNNMPPYIQVSVWRRTA